jgi:flagellar motility protein MotE (MotC chaperone)
MRLRLVPVVTTILMLTFTVRLGDFFVEALSGNAPTIKKSEAFAQDAEETLPKPAAMTDTPAEKAIDPDQTPAAKLAKAADDEKDAAAPEKEKDPFVEEYSEEEIKVLQSLSKRREQLEQRERDIEQRDKLLKAAEKKVDEKVAELATLRKEIETLLQKQQAEEARRTAQLVKIYQNMKPKDAANIFNEMDFDVLIKIVDQMAERRVAPILAAMDPARARDVSRRIAEQKSLPKPGE